MWKTVTTKIKNFLGISTVKPQALDRSLFKTPAKPVPAPAAKSELVVSKSGFGVVGAADLPIPTPKKRVIKTPAKYPAGKTLAKAPTTTKTTKTTKTPPRTSKATTKIADDDTPSSTARSSSYYDSPSSSYDSSSSSDSSSCSSDSSSSGGGCD